VDTARIAELIAPYAGEASAPSLAQLVNISTYINLLLKWNARTNLTAVRQEEEMVTRHFGESWFAARHLLAHSSASTVIDVGSGAGFPGLVLKLFAPALHLSLVESQNKKATFLKECVRTLQLSQVGVLNARAEQLELRASLVTLRAVERFESIVPTAARLVEPGGRMALLIGSGQLEQAESVVAGRWETPVAIPGASARVLAVCEPGGN
jgi:16S rRNA (guanine527-N7)-methyltransferase